MLYIIALELHRAIGLLFFWISTNEITIGITVVTFVATIFGRYNNPI